MAELAPNMYSENCKRGYFDDFNPDNGKLAKNCAEAKTKETGIPHIAVLVEEGVVFDDYRVEEAPPVARMWHLLKGLAAKNDPKVKKGNSETYSVAIEYEKFVCRNGIVPGDRGAEWCGQEKVATTLQFEYHPGKEGYQQYTFTLSNYGSVDAGFSCMNFDTAEKRAVVSAMQTYRICPTAEQIETLRSEWPVGLNWLFPPS